MAENYQVQGQRRYTEPTATGGVDIGYEITFATKPSNVISSIRVPDAQYNPEDVARLLDAEAHKIEEVHAL